MTCPGARSRINPYRTHRLCIGCALLVKYSEGTPRLVDDGVATCPDRVSHSPETIGAPPPECAPKKASVGRNTGGAE